MWSDRFQKNIWLTYHAKYAMEKRDIPEAVVYDLIETGEIKRKDNLNVGFLNTTRSTAIIFSAWRLSLAKPSL